MNRPDDLDPRALGPAWAALRKASGNRLGPIRTRAQYERMSRLLERLVDVVGDDERHELGDLLDLVGDLVEAWEASHVEIPEAEPRAVLRLLMESHGLKQGDLAEIASQSVISEILAGKRRVAVAPRCHQAREACPNWDIPRPWERNEMSSDQSPRR